MVPRKSSRTDCGGQLTGRQCGDMVPAIVEICSLSHARSGLFVFLRDLGRRARSPTRRPI
ncbi:hypothetical protein FCJ60_24770 [Burkholderia metallica]|nr:hypothetical protein [Burkholderia metallica]